MDLVVIHNDFNNVSLRGLKEKELDLLISLCYKLKDEGIEEIKLPFEELKKLSKYEGKDNQRFVKDLDSVYKKLIELNFKYEDENKIIRFVLFKSYEIDKNEKNVTIAVNEKFKYVLNQLTGNFTKFELNQFVSLNSQYSKNIFRLLKQFSNTGWREFLIDEFRRLLDIPEKYRISEIDKYVLNEKIIKELSESFNNLKVIKLKNGRSVYKIRFEWTVEKKEEVEVLPKTAKEKIAQNVIKQVEEAQNNKIDLKNKKVVTQEEFELLYKTYLTENDGIDNPTTRKFFSKRFEILADTQEEKEIQELTEEELELIKEFRIKKEKELTMTEQERFMTYEVVPDIESKYYKEKIGYEELFTDEDLLNDLTPEGYIYAEKFITHFQLFDELLSKNKKELNGSARNQKLIKVFKEHYINEFYGVHYKIAEERMLNENKF